MIVDVYDDRTLFFKDDLIQIRIYYPSYLGYYISTNIVNPIYTQCYIGLFYRQTLTSPKQIIPLGQYNLYGGLKDKDKPFLSCDDLFIYGYNIYLENKFKIKDACKKLCTDGMIKSILR